MLPSVFVVFIVCFVRYFTLFRLCVRVCAAAAAVYGFFLGS